MCISPKIKPNTRIKFGDGVLATSNARNQCERQMIAGTSRYGNIGIDFNLMNLAWIREVMG